MSRILLGVAAAGALAVVVLMLRLGALQEELSAERAARADAVEANRATNDTLNEVLAELQLREQWAAEQAAAEKAARERLERENRQLEDLAHADPTLQQQLDQRLHPDLFNWLWDQPGGGAATGNATRSTASDLSAGNPHPAKADTARDAPRPR